MAFGKIKQICNLLPLWALPLYLITSTAMSDCIMSRNSPLNLFINPSQKTSGSFSLEESSSISSSISRCSQDSGKYLMLSLGAARPGFYSDVLDITLNGDIADSRCILSDLPTNQKQTPRDRSDLLRESLSTIRKCLSLRVQDLSKNSLEFSSNQKNCKITTKEDGSIELEGDLCFVKIKPQNDFLITPTIKSDCLHPDFEGLNMLRSEDIQAVLNSYVAGDDSGSSTDIRPLGSRLIRLFFTPREEVFPITESFQNENLYFPGEYNVDIHMGELNLSSSSRGTDIYVSSFVQNFAEDSCLKDFCSSPSSFFQPVYGEFQFFEIHNASHNESLDIWYSGGVAAPQWEGFIKNRVHTIPGTQLKKGHRYRLTLTYTDPFDDFIVFLNYNRQILINLSSMENPTVAGYLKTLQSLPLMSSLPFLPVLSSSDNFSQDNKLLKTLENLNKIIGTRIWPCTYKYVCNHNRESCIQSGSQKFHTKIVFDFTAQSINPQSGRWELGDYKNIRISPTFNSYAQTPKNLPTLLCTSGFN